ncbi:MAG: hypothetical protein M3Y04_10470 [Actinomycetota bacterium]|nr:hypothetical protein [Actinomycetota bacterium]
MGHAAVMGHTGGVPGNAYRVQAAFDAAIAGDVEPLVALFDPQLEWRGVRSGRLWWRRTPS